MKSIFLFFFSFIFSITLYSQVTYIESHFDGEGGVDGLNYPNYIFTDYDGKNLYVTAMHSFAQIKSNNTYDFFYTVDIVKYSNDTMPGLWNANSIASFDENTFYVIGDDYLNVLTKDSTTNRFYLKQTVSDHDTLAISGYNLIISTDKKHLFLSNSGFDQNIVVFDIDTITGELTFSFDILINEQIYDIELSPDDRYLYSTSRDNSDTSIYVFEMIYETNAYNLVQSLHTESGLYLPSIIKISNDGQNAYVYDNKRILCFNINFETGLLSFRNDIIIDELFDDFWFGTDICISNDSESLYLSGNYSLSTFSRNTETGSLTFIDVIQEGVNNFYGFNYVKSLSISGNDSVLYALSKYNHSLLTFSRDKNSSLLTHISTTEQGDGTISGLISAIDLLISSDGKNVYTLSLGGSDIINIFNRDSSGTLQYNNLLKLDDLGPSIGGTNSFILSPDDRFMYIASTNMFGVRLLHRDNDDGSLNYFSSYTEPYIDFNGWVSDMAFSANLNYFYVSTGSHILKYAADANTGELEYLSDLSSDNSNLFGLTAIKSMVVSSDGKNLYTVSDHNFYEDGISNYSIDQTNGNLSVSQVFTEGIDENINAPCKILLSPDEKFLYSIGEKSHCFQRDSVNGNLMLLYEVSLDDLDIVNIQRLTDAYISKDGRSLIGVTGLGQSIISFYRDKESGELIFEEQEKYANNNSTIHEKICLSNDLKNVYLTNEYERELRVYDLNISIGLENETSDCGGCAVISVDEGFEYLWSTGDTTNFINACEPGIYYVYVTDSIGREGSDTISVYAVNPIFPDLGDDWILYPEQSLLLNPGNYFQSYLWSPDNSNSEVYLYEFDITQGDSVQISVQVTNEYDCIFSDTILILQKIPEDILLYPNPANSEVNLVSADNFLNYCIYNSKGEIIQSSDMQLDKKHINFSVDKLPRGVYFIKVQSESEIKIIKFILFE
ncbi:MAG: beta-propeller fold lactonase family protein [Bacteroidales bacterium]|nr:beta-propeller fold lactonase family protein [Bacteroidales bacterium]